MTTESNGTIYYGEDIPVGVPFELGAYTLSQEDLISFATRWDPLDFHTDIGKADGSYYGGIIASGIQTLAIFQRLAVRAQLSSWAIIAGKAIRNLRFHRPVRSGNVLHGKLTVISLTPDSKGRAHLIIQGSLQNQNGETALTLEMETLVYMSRKDHRLKTS